METARATTMRGHGVTVFDAANQPGGQIRLTAQSPRNKEMIGIIDWRMAECSPLGVNIRFKTRVDAADITAENPDIVIDATGAPPFSHAPTKGNEAPSQPWMPVR